MNLKKIYYTLPNKLRTYIGLKLNPILGDVEEKFINSNLGRDYGLNKSDRIDIVNKIRNILKNVKSATNMSVHLTLISKILEIPPSSNESYLVEAGCYYGATSCTMSLAAKILKKKLIIYDSFFGLPDDDDKELKIYDHLKIKGFYQKGMYAASKKEVEKNILKYGEYENCLFREGLFSDTMPKHLEKICFLFLDVDLKSSTKTSIKYLYPHILDNHYIFTDDSCDLSVVKIWFDENFWNTELNCSAPGYVGSGCGLPINGEFSSLGYSVKNINTQSLQNTEWLNKEPSVL